MNELGYQPHITELNLVFQIAQADADAECIQLLTKVMEGYTSRLKPQDQNAIAHWFSSKYGHRHE